MIKRLRTGALAAILLALQIGFFSSYRIAVVPVSVEAMTLSKMQAVVTAITNAGFAANASLRADGTWQIRSDATDYTVDVATICTFATNQAVSAKVSSVVYW